jgi:hypothetical protein
MSMTASATSTDSAAANASEPLPSALDSRCLSGVKGTSPMIRAGPGQGALASANPSDVR